MVSSSNTFKITPQKRNSLGLQIPIESNTNLSVLLCANEVAVIIKYDKGIQNLLDTLSQWSKKGEIKHSKSQAGHFI